MKKLLINAHTKTPFSDDNLFYQQSDGVSLGSSVVPVLAIIILTEFENFVMKLLMENKILKVYYVYVVDMVVLVKVKEVQVG